MQQWIALPTALALALTLVRQRRRQQQRPPSLPQQQQQHVSRMQNRMQAQRKMEQDWQRPQR